MTTETEESRKKKDSSESNVGRTDGLGTPKELKNLFVSVRNVRNIDELNEFITMCLVQGMGYRRTSEAVLEKYGVKIPKSTLNEHFPRAEIDKIKAEIQGSGERASSARSPYEPGLSAPFAPASPGQGAAPPFQPGPGVYMSPQAIVNLRNMMTPAQQRVFDAQIGVSTQYMERARGNPGNPQFHFTDPVDEELQKLERQALREYRIDRLTRRGRGNGEDKRVEFLEKLVLEGYKSRGNQGQMSFKDMVMMMMEMQGKQQQGNWDFYTRQMELMKSIGPSGLTDEAALKIKEMEMNFEKWKMETASEVNKWNNLTQIFGPALERGIPALVAQFTGQPSGRPRGTQIQCPKCGYAPWIIALNAREAKCPQCGEPAPKEIFAGPQATRFKCEGCGIEMTIPAERISQLVEKGVKQIPAKCPKCGHITNLTQQPAETEASIEEAPKEEKPTRTKLRPTCR